MRWLFRLIFPIAVLASGSCQPPAPSVHDDMAIVRSYCDRDLMQAKEEEVKPLQDALARLRQRSNERKESPIDGIPYYVWRFDRLAEAGDLLVLDELGPRMHPGTSNLRFTLLSDVRQLRSTARFGTGYRHYLYEASLKEVPGFDAPVVVLVVGTQMGPCDSRQYLALAGDRFELIRLEDQHGKAIRNTYDDGNDHSGPPVIQETAEQWETDLYAVDRARVLRALVWLSGWHRDESAPLATKVKSRPAVAMRLRELAERGPAWEREMAALAL